MKPSVIAFMGLDGSGKSTQAEALEGLVAAAGARPVRIHHASTKVPFLRTVKLRYHRAAVRALAGGSAGAKGDGRSTPGGGLWSLRWLMAIYFLAGSFLKSAWYRWWHREKVLLLDRCFLDDAVKVRWRLGVETRLSRRLLRLAPKPDVVIVLEGDSRQTFARKKDQNCTYVDYLRKKEYLDIVLREAGELGWVVERLAIDGLEVSEVSEGLLEILRRHGIDPDPRRRTNPPVERGADE